MYKGWLWCKGCSVRWGVVGGVVWFKIRYVIVMVEGDVCVDWVILVVLILLERVEVYLVRDLGFVGLYCGWMEGSLVMIEYYCWMWWIWVWGCLNGGVWMECDLKNYFESIIWDRNWFIRLYEDKSVIGWWFWGDEVEIEWF